MAIQVLGQEGLGDILGKDLGSSLSQGLQQLMQIKMNQALQRHQQQQAEKGFKAANLPANLAYLPTQVQAAYVKNHLKQPSEQAFGQAADILSQLENAQYQPEQQALMPSALMPSAQMPQSQMPMAQFENNLASLLGINAPGSTMPQASQMQMSKMQEPQMQSVTQTSPTQVSEINIPTAKSFSLSNLSPEKKQMLNQALRQMTPAQRKDFENMRKEKEKEFKEEQKAIDKEYKPFVTDIKTKAKAAKENSMRLDKMEQLIKTKNLSRPRFAAAIGALKKGAFGVGLDLSSLLTPESQEFEKTSQDFLKNIKDVFGSRILETEIENYLKTIPNLSMNREGKYRVINDLRLMNEAAMTKDKALDEIRLKNNGHLPANVDILVEQIAKPKLDEIAAKFKQGWQKPVKAPKEKSATDMLAGGIKTLSPNSLLNALFGKG